MGIDSILLTGGSVLGIAGITAAAFVVVSFSEIKKKSDEGGFRRQAIQEMREGNIDDEAYAPIKQKKQKKGQSKKKQKS